MFSDKCKARLAGLALAGAVLSIPGVASAGVVVKSSGPSAGSYPVGRQVADSATITLRAGDKITVLTDDGTKVMQGPGTFRVGEGATRQRARFSNLTRRNASSRSRTGAVRSAGEGTPQRPNLWLVDVTSEGTTCLYDFERVRLWRPTAEEAQTYTVTNSTSANSLDVTFAGTEAIRALDPAILTLSSGAAFTISGPTSPEMDGEGAAEDAMAENPAAGQSAPQSVNVTFALMPQDALTGLQVAQALAERGCTNQLALLADVAEAEASR
ncbi:hypothetical protein CD351_13205 [Erythrobacter sp. KY5]|nr:hypothetical protein CD351_13205 [Erythrobacter sp. KY5]